MKRHRLSRREVAAVLRTPVGTFAHWVDGHVEPPGAIEALLDVIEACGCARRALGVYAAKRGAPRGRPFTKGNEWRWTDPRRQEYERARAT